MNGKIRHFAVSFLERLSIEPYFGPVVSKKALFFRTDPLGGWISIFEKQEWIDQPTTSVVVLLFGAFFLPSLSASLVVVGSLCLITNKRQATNYVPVTGPVTDSQISNFEFRISEFPRFSIFRFSIFDFIFYYRYSSTRVDDVQCPMSNVCGKRKTGKLENSKTET